MIAKEFTYALIWIASMMLFALGIAIGAALFLPTLGHSWKITRWSDELSEEWFEKIGR